MNCCAPCAKNSRLKTVWYYTGECALCDLRIRGRRVLRRVDLMRHNHYTQSTSPTICRISSSAGGCRPTRSPPPDAPPPLARRKPSSPSLLAASFCIQPRSHEITLTRVDERNAAPTTRSRRLRTGDVTIKPYSDGDFSLGRLSRVVNRTRSRIALARNDQQDNTNPFILLAAINSAIIRERRETFPTSLSSWAVDHSSSDPRRTGLRRAEMYAHMMVTILHRPPRRPLAARCSSDEPPDRRIPRRTRVARTTSAMPSSSCQGYLLTDLLLHLRRSQSLSETESAGQMDRTNFKQ